MAAASPEPASPTVGTPGPHLPQPAYPLYMPQEEHGFDPFQLVRVVWKRKWLIALVTLLGTSAAVAYAVLATPMFRAEAVIAPPEQKKAGGASAALAAFGGFGAEIAGSLGVSLGGADANRLEALLKSHRLLASVVEKHQLLPVLFPDDWDPATGRWNVEVPEDIPNIWDARKKLGTLYRVGNDIKTGLLGLSFEFEDPATAEAILRHFLAELAVLMQEDELKKIEENRRFAEAQLETATDPVIVTKLQSLLSEQFEKAMMAQNVAGFAYELIDPPAGSDQKVRPKRALIGALGLGTSGLLGLLLAFFVEWLGATRAAAVAGDRARPAA